MIKMRVEIEELDEEKSKVVLTFDKEIYFETIVEILKSSFQNEMFIEHCEDCFIISFITDIERSKKLSQNINKLFANLNNRLN